MGAFEISFKGHTELQRALAQLAQETPNEIGEALHDEALMILGEAREITPWDRGELWRSGKVEKVTDAGGVSGVRIGFGGPAAPYALAVHEHLSGYSPPSWKTAEAAGHPVQWGKAGTGPKYLERPFVAAAPGLPAKIAARIAALIARHRKS